MSDKSPRPKQRSQKQKNIAKAKGRDPGEIQAGQARRSPAGSGEGQEIAPQNQKAGSPSCLLDRRCASRIVATSD